MRLRWMKNETKNGSAQPLNGRRRYGAIWVVLCATAVAASATFAQGARGQAAPQGGAPAGRISREPPAIPVEQIIQKFAQRESEFRRERENFVYQQSFTIQTIDYGGQVDGEYRMDSDIVFSPTGKRYEKVTFAPASSLTRIGLTQQDLKDLESIQPFVLTTEDLPKYDVRYIGREKLDELSTYVFEVAPKKIEKNERYFQGRVWVDEDDLAIVKSLGKAVPDLKENVFPRFETYRENIEKNYWFPTYTHADDVLHFRLQDVHIRMTVKYKNYKRFASTGKIVGAAEVAPDKGKPDKDKQ